MTDDHALTSVLACPRCDRSPLERSEGGYACAGCQIDYPDVAGMPWLFAEPRAALEEWRGRWSFALRSLERTRAQIGRALAASSLRASTRNRLERLDIAYAEHAAKLGDVLAPLLSQELSGEYSTHLALRTRLPPDQGLLTYYNNVHRDWAWGREENEQAHAIVAAALNAATAERVLVLGAGAGRLAYDLHSDAASRLTVALDFNPFLALVGKRVSSGELVELYEFPIAPKSSDEQALLRQLGAPKPAHPGLEFVIADTHRAPFEQESFDAVVTPWLIDILPEALETFAQRINALLASGGLWVNIGSLSFFDNNPVYRYNIEECTEIVAECGFDEPRIRESSMPYMCSPASRHGRIEQVVSWSAAKNRKSKKAPRYEAMPDWLVRGNTAVPLLEPFRTQAATTRVHAYVMSLIDGKRSVKDIARLVSQQGLMSYQDAEPSIRSFLIKMYDEARRMGF